MNIGGLTNGVNPILAAYANGFYTCAGLISALFFLRFWRRSGDSLFLGFSIAFVMMAGNSVAPAILGSPNDHEPGVYLLRLFAFLVIVFSILRKNLARRD